MAASPAARTLPEHLGAAVQSGVVRSSRKPTLPDPSPRSGTASCGHRNNSHTPILSMGRYTLPRSHQSRE
ncbi:unnamed protein product [Boreogadus saida]